MSTQHDIYAASSENRPPILNKENYVPWSSHLLRYAKSRPNGKLIYNSIINGPYVEDDDQAIQTILLGLPEDIYAAVDSCETAQEIWLRVQQMMKVQNVRNQVVQNAVQNPGVQNVGNQNRLIVVPGIVNQNPDRNGNVVATRAKVRPRRKDVGYLQTQLLIAQKEEARIQLQAEEFDLMAAAADLDEIEEVNANCILMANL
ncbi:hypothetical protein Tco_1061798 [Tanacetum coccineum]